MKPGKKKRGRERGECVCVCVCGGGDWLREGCLIPSRSVIGREAWPHLKAGLLQFIDCGALPRCSHTSAWPQRYTRSAGRPAEVVKTPSPSHSVTQLQFAFFFFYWKSRHSVQKYFNGERVVLHKLAKKKTPLHASNVCLI